MEPSLEKRANILSHLEERSQVQFLQQLSRPELVRLINRMDSDDVADLLGKMTPEESNAVLADMEQEDSVEVADLFRVPGRFCRWFNELRLFFNGGKRYRCANYSIYSG